MIRSGNLEKKRDTTDCKWIGGVEECFNKDEDCMYCLINYRKTRLKLENLSKDEWNGKTIVALCMNCCEMTEHILIWYDTWVNRKCKKCVDSGNVVGVYTPIFRLPK